MKKTRRRVIQMAIIGAVASIAYGAAASLGGITSDTLGAGSTAVQSCDFDGLTTAYTIVSDEVTEVVVGDIAAACSDGQLSITLTDSSDQSIATGEQVVDDTSHSIPVSPPPPAADVAGVHVVIVGP